MDPAVYRNITGTVSVYATQKQACDQLLGRTGASIFFFKDFYR
jgi:hypothetical protein